MTAPDAATNGWRVEVVVLLNLLEVALIAVTAVVTVLTALFVGRQASRHFRLQRSTHFIERFNTGDMLRMRPRVDSFVAREPEWEALLEKQQEASLDEETLVRLYETAVFANFFQELATALRHKTLDHTYTWDVFGGIVSHYWGALEPYVRARRLHGKRPTLYQNFEELVAEMRRLDR